MQALCFAVVFLLLAGDPQVVGAGQSGDGDVGDFMQLAVKTDNVNASTMKKKGEAGARMMDDVKAADVEQQMQCLARVCIAVADVPDEEEEVMVAAEAASAAKDEYDCLAAAAADAAAKAAAEASDRSEFLQNILSVSRDSIHSSSGERQGGDVHFYMSYGEHIPWQVECLLWTVGLFLPILTAVISLAQEQQLDAPSLRITLAVLLSVFVRQIDYTVVIPTVYDLVSSATMDSAVASGFMIGAFHGTAIVGVLLRRFTPLDKLPFRHITFLMMAVYPLASVIYVASAYVRHGGLTLLFMATSRCIAGVAEGVLCTVHWATLARVSPSDCATKILLLYSMAENMGMALGPIVSSGSLRHLTQLVQCEENVLPSAIMGLVHMAVFLLVVLLLPSDADITIACQEEGFEGENDGPKSDGCLVPAVLSAVIVLLMYTISGGLESATALILEEQFGWKPKDIGYAICACISLFLPVLLLQQLMSSALSEPMTQRFALSLMCVATMFLLPAMCNMFQSRLQVSWGCDIFILICDALVFPMTFIVTGLAESGVFSIAGSRYVEEFSAFLSAAGSIIYLIAQPSARLLAEWGVFPYACLQVALSAAAIFFTLLIDLMTGAKS